MRRIRKHHSEYITLPPSKDVDEFRVNLLSWFQSNGRIFPWRNKSVSNYHYILAEVMLQRTKAETIAKFWPGFIKKYPSWRALSKASEVDLQNTFKPIGLWQRRAASLFLLAQEMNRRRGLFPKKRDEIEALPGVGQYIANAILLFCSGEPHPLLDSNMARVLERYFGPRKLADIRYDPYLQSLSKQVVNSEQAIIINWAILDLAAMICKIKMPACITCPLNRNCNYAMHIIEASG